MNMAVTWGTVSSGFDKSSVNRFLSTLVIPSLPSSFDEVLLAVQSVLSEILAANRASTLALHPNGKVPIKLDGKFDLLLSIRS